MYAKQRVSVALPEIHGACSQRVGGTAMHAEAALQLNQLLFEIGPTLNHFLRRIPVRPFLLALDRRFARPGETLAADTDAIASSPGHRPRHGKGSDWKDR